MNTATPAAQAVATSSRAAVERYARVEAGYAERLAGTEALLRRAAQESPAVQANSLGAEDMVVLHIINRLELPIAGFVLDTGRLHAETLALLERTQRAQASRPDAPLKVYRPDADAVDALVAQQGLDGIYRSIDARKRCCAVRKLEPLGRALAGHRAWVTGLRREQSESRQGVLPIEADGKVPGGPALKFNPLADWSWGDVWRYIAEHEVDYNALHDHFYPSIGCEPCTRAVALGEDLRAGRWWWEQENVKECGLHVTPLNAQGVPK